MEKNNFDLGLEFRQHFDQQVSDGDEYNRRGFKKRFSGKGIVRRRKGLMTSPDVMVVGDANHANIFKKIKKGVKKVAAKVEKVALKVTPKPLRKIAKKVIAVHKKVGKAVGKVVGKIALYPALIPLIPVMAAGLKKAKVKVPKDPGKMAEAFYLYVIKKQKPGTTYENSDHIAPAIAALIPTVIKFIKDMVQKGKAKKAGKAVDIDPIDEAVADVGSQVIEGIEQKILADKTSSDGSNESVLAEPLHGESPLYMGDTGPKEDSTITERQPRAKGAKKEGFKLSFNNPIVIGGLVVILLGAFFLMRKK